MTESNAAAVASTEAAPTPQNAPKKAAVKKGASPSKNAPKAKQGAKEARPRKQAKAAERKPAAKKQGKPKKAGKPATEAREGSKKAIILDLLRRKDGATLAELMKATKWQTHSVRGFVAILKRAGHTVESTKSEAGERTYRIAK